MLIHQNNQVLKFEVFILTSLPTGQNSFEMADFFERDLQNNNLHCALHFHTASVTMAHFQGHMTVYKVMTVIS